jgi:predicted nucleotidyltransferase
MDYMKTTSEYIALLRKYMTENSHKYGIIRIGIFGSVARGEQTEDSDVDVCVELQTPSMFDLVHIKDELQLLFDCAVDIVRLRDDMDGLLKQNIVEEGIYA